MNIIWFISYVIYKYAIHIKQDIFAGDKLIYVDIPRRPALAVVGGPLTT